MAVTKLKSNKEKEQNLARFTPTGVKPKNPKEERKTLLDNWKPKTGIIEKIKEWTKREHYEKILITPDMAMDILTLNDSYQNRPFKEDAFNRYTQQMKDGTFRYNGDPIRISKSHKLIDGQHRLWSIVASGKPQYMFLQTGHDDETFGYIDIGKNRSGSDLLTILGYGANKGTLSYAIKLIINYNETGMVAGAFNSGRIPNSKFLEFGEDKIKMKMLNDFIGYAKEKLREDAPFFTISQWAFLLYILHNLSGNHKTAAKVFVDKLSEGANLKTNSPIFVARKLLEVFEEKFANRIRKSTNAAKLSVKFQIVFKAWNHEFRNEKVSSIEVDWNTLNIPKPSFRLYN